MINRACEKKKQAEQIREDVKHIVEFYGKLSDESDSYQKDLEKVQTKFAKYLNKVARILERKVNWEDYSNAERRHVENAVMLAQLLCYMCSVNLVLAPTVEEPLERLNEADINKAKADANDVMSQLKSD